MYHPRYSREQLVELAGIKQGDLMAGFDYGSRMYETYDADSDYDYIMIAKNVDGEYQISHEDINITVYSESKWNSKVDNHDIDALECLSQYSDNYSGISGIDTAKLRSSISRTASNSWVKCKKKLTVETDSRRVAIKSLFHSFRIPMFGIQIAKHGVVHDFHQARRLWVEMMPLLSNDVGWDEINETYKKRHNELMSEFRKYAEKA